MRGRKYTGKWMTGYIKGWLMTEPVLFVKKDGAYPEDPEDMMIRMNDLMVKERFFKNPDLTIGQLCMETNTNRAYLSRSIHRTFGSNFSKWVNLFRIEEAKRLMRQRPEKKWICLIWRLNADSIQYVHSQEFSRQKNPVLQSSIYGT